MEENYQSKNASSKKFHDLTPEEAREKAKLATGKATAAATGSVEGYAENADPKVMGQVRETVKETAQAVKQPLQESGMLPHRSAAPEPATLGISQPSEPGMFSKAGDRVSTSMGNVTDKLSASASNVRTKVGDQVGTIKESTSQKMTQAAETYRTSSPEELREKAKNAVGRGVASAAGAMEGYVEQSDPSVLREATQKAVESVRELTGKSGSESGSEMGSTPRKPQSSSINETLE